MEKQSIQRAGYVLSIMFAINIALFPFVDRATSTLFLLVGIGFAVLRWRGRIPLVQLQAPALAVIAFCVWASTRTIWSGGDLSAALKDPLKLLLVMVLVLNIQSVLGRVPLPRLLGLHVLIISGVAAYFILRMGIWGSPLSPPPLVETDFNQRVVSLVLCAFAVATLPVRNRLDKAGLGCMLCLVGAAAFLSHSAAAQLAWIMGVLSAALCYYAPRLTVIIGTILVLGLMLMMPQLLTLGLSLSESSTIMQQDFLVQAAADARVIIWTDAIALIQQNPVFGWGLEQAPQELRTFGQDGRIWEHPHNQFLQIHLEVGLVGVLLAIIPAGIILSRTLRHPPHKRPFLMALCCGFLIIASVSHGLWQSWWLALLPFTWLLATASFSIETSTRAQRSDPDVPVAMPGQFT